MHDNFSAVLTANWIPLVKRAKSAWGVGFVKAKSGPAKRPECLDRHVTRLPTRIELNGPENAQTRKNGQKGHVCVAPDVDGGRGRRHTDCTWPRHDLRASRRSQRSSFRRLPPGCRTSEGRPHPS